MAPCNESLITLGDDAVSTEIPIYHGLTYHQLGLILCAVFGLLATIISLIIIMNHATHYSKPHEQRYIIRILAMIPVYAIISFVSYYYFRRAIYWQVIRDCYEAIAIASFFSLLSHYIAPTLHDQKDWARKLEPKNWVLPLNWLQKCTGGQEKGLLRKPRSGLTYFNIIYLGVFQYCFFRIVLTFVAMISQLFNRYCESSNSPEYAHVWVLAFEALSVTIAMYCLIQFYVQIRLDIAEHRPLLKILSIKLVIFLSFWQNLIISFLASTRGNGQAIIHSTPHLSYADIIVGIPSTALCIEMFLFSILHIFAFPVRSEYNIKNSPDPNARYHGGFLGWRAILDAVLMWDLVKALARAFRWLFVGRRRREQDVSYMLGRQRVDGDTGYEGYRENVKLQNLQRQEAAHGDKVWSETSPERLSHSSSSPPRSQNQQVTSQSTAGLDHAAYPTTTSYPSNNMNNPYIDSTHNRHEYGYPNDNASAPLNTNHGSAAPPYPTSTQVPYPVHENQGYHEPMPMGPIGTAVTSNNNYHNDLTSPTTSEPWRDSMTGAGREEDNHGLLSRAQGMGRR